MICEGTIPEHEIVTLVEREVIGETVELEDGTHEHPVTLVTDEVREMIPARPCDQPATLLARSMAQVTCELYDRLPNPQDGIHWLKTADHVYCGGHFVAGTMTHLDGRVTSHPAMSVEDA